MRQYYDIDKIEKFNKIVIFGCGDFGRKVYRVIKQRKKIVAIIDNDNKKWGSNFAGDLRIESPEKALRDHTDALFCIASLRHNDEICQQLLKEGISDENILKIENEMLIERIQSRYIRYTYENKYFIYARPQKRTITAKVSKFKYLYMDICNCIRMKLCKIKPIEKKYRVSICAIFKNEALYLKEWLEFHLLVGIDHFYLYNNTTLQVFD